jgi:hypothetical protein
LFIALPIGNVIAVSGYTPMIDKVPAFARASTAQSNT